MNKLIAAINAMIFTLILLLTGNVTAGTGTFIGPTTGVDDNGGKEEVTGTVGTFEQIVTVIKNEKPKVSGNLFCSLPAGIICPDSDALSLELLSGPTGNFGFLDISANGQFSYSIKNDLQQVQALGFHDVAKEIFNYTVREESGRETSAKLTIFILGNPSVSFDNVEIEPNNSSTQAGPIHVGNALGGAQQMRGQIATSGDVDWFVFNSLGNEIINLELCPEGSQCVDEKAWVMYVFDADKFSTGGDENNTVTLRTFIELTNETLSSFQSNHMYLLFNSGAFRNSLVGVIDPCFGDRRTLDIGVGVNSKNYLVAISSPLARSSLVNGGSINSNEINESSACGSGSVVLEREIGETTIDLDGDGIKTDITKIIEQFIVAFPFSDDQYSFKVTRTGADPFAVISPNNTTFDAIGRKVNIPNLRIDNQLFAVELQEINAASENIPATFGIVSTELLNIPLSADPYLPTYNPTNQIVKIPQVTISESGDLYSVELKYQPSDGTLKLLKAKLVK